MAIQYFTHDFNARSDPKLLNLRADLGMQGIGAYWCLIEILFEQKGYIETSSLKGIAYELQIEKSMLEDILTKYDLFIFENDKYFSNGVLKRMAKIQEKRQKALESINKRWENNTNEQQNNTDEIRTKYERNTNVIRTKYKDKDKDKDNIIKEKINKKKNLVANAPYATALCDFLNSKSIEFKEAWNAFLQFRKGKKGKDTDYALYLLTLDLEKLAPKDEQGQLKIIQQSLKRKWTGIFEFKEELTKTRASPPKLKGREYSGDELKGMFDKVEEIKI
jgi:NADH:ubiquinone oxidoreductase subunit E